VRLLLGVIAYNVGNLLRRRVLPPAIPAHPEPIATDMIKDMCRERMAYPHLYLSRRGCRRRRLGEQRTRADCPVLAKAVSGPGEHIEGQVIRKQRDGNRLLVKITTAQGPMLVTFTQKVADLDVLLDAGDTMTLFTPRYATFVDGPLLERVKGPARGQAPLPPSSTTTPQPSTR